MRIKFIKPHPILHKDGKIGSGSPNFFNAPIKGMNLIIQGYAKLVHSCKGCNPYHIEMTEEDYNKPFRINPQWTSDNCKKESNNNGN